MQLCYSKCGGGRNVLMGAALIGGYATSSAHPRFVAQFKNPMYRCPASTASDKVGNHAQRT